MFYLCGETVLPVGCDMFYLRGETVLPGGCDMFYLCGKIVWERWRVLPVW